jgi:hypothetical protein
MLGDVKCSNSSSNMKFDFSSTDLGYLKFFLTHKIQALFGITIYLKLKL